MLNCLDWSGSG